MNVVVVVPIKGYFKIWCAGPISRDWVTGLKTIQKMVNIIFIWVYYPKIVQDKGESNVLGLVFVQTLSESIGQVAGCGKNGL